MPVNPEPTLGELLARPCPQCGERDLIVREVDALDRTVTLLCVACWGLQHRVPYRDDAPPAR